MERSEPAESRLTLTLRPDAGVISFVGELDGDSYPHALGRVLDCVRADGSQPWTFDMEQVAFIDSAGLRLLIQASLALDDGHRITLASPSPMLRRILEVTSCEPLFTLDPPTSGDVVSS